MGNYCSIMRAAILLATVVAVATGAPKFSKKALSTPLSRGGGRIVGGTEAYAGEFPHQIALLRGGVGGSLMCGGSLVAENMVGTADFGSSVIGKIGLPYDGEEYSAGTTCTVSGWGTTSEGGSLAKVLMKVDVPVVSDDDCRGSYGQSEIADSMICAGLDAGGKDSCQGDSGGPFMCGNQLSGVVSWGYGCAEAGYPGVYTQPSYFISWLNSHMK